MTRRCLGLAVAFSLHTRILAEGLTQHFPPVHFFFFKWRSAHAHQFNFRPGSVHSGSVSWDNCGWTFSDELHASFFAWKAPTLCLNSTDSPLNTSSDLKCVCIHICNLPPELLAEWPGSFMRRYSNTGVQWTPKSAQKVNSGEESYPTALRERTRDLPITNPSLYNTQFKIRL